LWLLVLLWLLLLLWQHRMGLCTKAATAARLQVRPLHVHATHVTQQCCAAA
jgi:hypothetical protein